MAVRESGLVAAIQKEIRKQYPDAWLFKVVGNPYQETGVPDLLVCVNGLLIGIEVKFPYPNETVEHALSRATPQQQVQIMRINRAGGMAGVVASVEAALELIERGLKHRREESDGTQHHLP